MASTEFLNKAYLAYFGRPMDFTGSVAFANSSETDVANAFAASAESQALYGTTIDANFVNAVYQNLFGRAAEPAGIAYWLNEYYNGTLTAAGVAIAILEGAQGTDITKVDNKLAAAQGFFDALDTTEEVLGYSTALAAETARSWLATVVETPATGSEIDAAVAAASVTATESSVIYLDTDVELTAGTSANDLFKAYIFDNDNSLQSGDVISGGAGTDTLYAKVGNSQAFAINAETLGVEIVQIRAQTVASDAADNNPTDFSDVQIDAQDMVGVNWWESNNSRADLLIEDVRILPSQITKDITIAFVESDPGNVDYAVYFDQYSLKTTTATSSTLSLELMDTRSAVAGDPPLLNNPYWGFAFTLTLANGDSEVIGITADAIDEATTYSELLAAIQEAIVANAALTRLGITDTFTASIGADFTAVDTLTGDTAIGQTIVVTTTAGSISYGETGTGWVAEGPVPPSSGLHTDMSSAGSSAVDLVTSTIVLDDVGRGSMGGDLLVGGLSVGYTSESKGVERFNIEVRDNSKLQVISSTNNTLQEVIIHNGVTTSSDWAYGTVEKDAGDLTVTGDVDMFPWVSSEDWVPGQLDSNNEYGFTDVRLIDASVMTGNFTFDALISEDSIAKYMDLLDTASDLSSADVIDFVYTGGTNGDTMAITIDGDVLASNSNIVSGREDFTFTANGGAGDDDIIVHVTDGLVGGADAWYDNQKLNANVFVNGGSGDDTILTYGAGDAIITGGEGNDTVYADNSGTKAAFVFNTLDQALATSDYRLIDDLESDYNDGYNLYKADLTVTFKGLTSKVTVPSYANYKTDDLQINQAIKDAINNDAVLSKLLVATDGPANTLVVTSLIDGVMVLPTDLTVALAATTLTAAEADMVEAAWGVADATVAMAAAITAFDAAGDYDTQFAESATAVTITGTDSVTTSDNTITGGLGNDVIVLGTTGLGTDADFTNDIGLITADTVLGDQMLASNDTVVYDAAFGNDTIVNFVIDTDPDSGDATSGYDVLDFSALVNNGTLTIDLEVAALDTLAEVQAAELAADSSVSLAISESVLIYHNGNNVADVYQVVDGKAIGDTVVTLMGTIDLADTAWTAVEAQYDGAGTYSIVY